MCGIIGYVGYKNAAPILLEGLSRLEYRGYDSAGVATLSSGKLNVAKTKGRICALSNQIKKGELLNGSIGIGHTRWATHGEPTYENSHPHVSYGRMFAVVHNGIIENYKHLKDMLIEKGIEFVSQTDTEVIAHLLEYYYDGDILKAVSKVTRCIEGSYSLGIICVNNPDCIYAAKKSSPMIIGVGENESFIASDASAVPVKTAYYLDDGEIAVIEADRITVMNSSLEPITKKEHLLHNHIQSTDKKGYEHYMMKEIDQQPEVVKKTLDSMYKDGKVCFEKLKLTKNINMIYIIACGTSYHVGVVGKYIIEKLCRIPTEAIIASEFRYTDSVIGSNDLAVLISQSGETADTIAALKEAKSKGAKTLAIVNVQDSTIANEADNVIYTLAGQEIAVASTKAYSTQLAAVYMLALYFADVLDTISPDTYKQYMNELMNIPSKLETILNSKEKIKRLAYNYQNCKSVFFMGRNLDYAVSMEGSLKLKEISYIHSEAYAAGELKHGTISLVEKDTLVVVPLTVEKTFDKTVSNIEEVRARGGEVIVICPANKLGDIDSNYYSVSIPETPDLFSPFLSVVPLQIFAYYVAYFRGCDIDKPRNLAKSVTVE